MSRTLTIEIPAEASYVRLVRMLVSAFAAETAGLDETRAAVVRLAASETCTAVLAALSGDAVADRLRLVAVADDDGVEVEVRTRSPQAQAAWDLTIVRALADAVDVRTEGAEQVARLHVDTVGPVGTRG